MRVTYLSVEANLGGGERCLLDVMASVKRARPDVVASLVVGSDAGPLLDEARARGVTVVPLPFPEAFAHLGDSPVSGESRARRAVRAAGKLVLTGPRLLAYARRLRATLASLAPDVIHSNGLKFHVLASAARPRARLVWHVHDYLAGRPAARPLLRLAARRAHAAIAISRSIGEDARLLGLPVTVVANAIDTDAFAPGPRTDAIDALAGWGPSAAPRVGLVATFARWKGQDAFLDAAARVPGARFYVVGGPIYRTKASQFSIEELRARATALGIADRVAFVPFQADVAAVYRDLDVVVHASTAPEPFGRTIVEAMACARPVVVSAAGGAAEVFTEGVDALGTPPGDVPALAAALQRLVADAGLRARLGERARRTAVGAFSLERFGREIAAVYEGTPRSA